MHDKFFPTLLLAYKVVDRDIMTLGTTPVLVIGGLGEPSLCCAIIEQQKPFLYTYNFIDSNYDIKYTYKMVLLYI